jgi:hypothetical protein
MNGFFMDTSLSEQEENSFDSDDSIMEIIDQKLRNIETLSEL